MELNFRDIPFAGRGAELELLRDCVNESKAPRDATTIKNDDNDDASTSSTTTAKVRLCVIEGAAGMGKSTLIENLEKRITAKSNRKDNNLLICRAKFSSGDDADASSSSPLAAFGECLVDLIHQLVAIQENNPPSQLEKKDWRTILADEFRSVKDEDIEALHPDLYHLLARTRPGSPSPTSGKASRRRTSLDDCVSIASDQSSSVFMTENTIDQYKRDKERIALRSAFRRIAKSRPVVMILDDVHWISPAALRVLITLVMDRRLSGVLIICAHRELDANHFFRTALPKASEKIKQIYLGGLESASIGCIIARLLHREEADIVPLADCVFRKTKGNSFYVVQFLRFLVDGKFFNYSTSTFRWEWDLDRIRNETELSDNVVDLVIAKIEGLHLDVKNMLTTAACLESSTFRASILCRLLPYESSDKKVCQDHNTSSSDANLIEIEKQLIFATKEGLLETVEESRYKFSHSKIREGAKKLLPRGDELKTFQRFLGARLLEFATETRKDDIILSNRMLLVATNLLDKSTVDSDRADLLELNLQASELAMRRSAYRRAVGYLESASRFQSRKEMRWSGATYFTSMRLLNNLAQCRFYSGDLAGSIRATQDIIDNSHSFEERVAATKLQGEILFHQSKYKESLKLSVGALDDLGHHLPRHNLSIRCFLSLLGLDRDLRKMTDQFILNLPVNEDPLNSMKINLLFTVGVTCACIDKELYKQIAMVDFERLVLKTGGEIGTLPMCLSTASVLYSKLGMAKMSDRLHKLSLALLDRDGSESIHGAKAVGFLCTMVNHQQNPYQDSLTPLLRSIRTLEQSGAMDAAASGLLGYSQIYFHSGLQLRALLPDMTKSAELLQDYGQLQYLSLYQPLAQLVSNLCGSANNPKMLTGDFMDYETCISEWTMNNNQRAISLCHCYRMYLCYFMGQSEEAYKDSVQLNTQMKPTPYCAPKFLLQGIIECCMVDISKSRRSRTNHVKAAKKFLKKLQKYVERGNPNCVHMKALLGAQIDATEKLHNLSRKKAMVDIQKSFDKAIVLAARGGFLHDQAIGNQRAGMFFLALDKIQSSSEGSDSENNRFWAGTYLSRSIELFDRWGAVEVVNSLNLKHGTFLQSHTHSLRSKFGENDNKNGLGVKARSQFGNLGEEPDDIEL